MNGLPEVFRIVVTHARQIEQMAILLRSVAYYLPIVTGEVHAEKKTVSHGQSVWLDRLAIDQEDWGLPVGIEDVLVISFRLPKNQAQLVKGEPSTDLDRERARGQLQVQLARIASMNLIKSMAVVGYYARENVEPPS